MVGSSGVLPVQHTCLRDVRFYIFPNNKTYTTSNVHHAARTHVMGVFNNQCVRSMS